MNWKAFFIKLLETVATGLTLHDMDTYQYAYQPGEREGIFDDGHLYWRKRVQ